MNQSHLCLFTVLTWWLSGFTAYEKWMKGWRQQVEREWVTMTVSDTNKPLPGPRRAKNRRHSDIISRYQEYKQKSQVKNYWIKKLRNWVCVPLFVLLKSLACGKSIWLQGYWMTMTQIPDRNTVKWPYKRLAGFAEILFSFANRAKRIRSGTIGLGSRSCISKNLI